MFAFVLPCLGFSRGMNKLEKSQLSLVKDQRPYRMNCSDFTLRFLSTYFTFGTSIGTVENCSTVATVQGWLVPPWWWMQNRGIIRNSFNGSPKMQIQYPPWVRVAQKSLSSSSLLDFLVVMPSAIRDEKSDRRIIQINQLNVTDLERNFKDHRHGCFNSTKNRKVQNGDWSGNTSTSWKSLTWNA